MDKNAIKKYAVWARRELISRVSQKALQYGITEKEIVDAAADSVNGKLLSAEEKKQRQALIAQINEKGYEQVMEEVAYTWFNRFSALRFMEVNNYLPSHVRVFTDEDNNFKPQIITEAIHLDLDGLDMEKVYAYKDADQTEELYKYLLIVQCNALNKILPGMFQRISDYTELLLPDNLLREGSVIEQMITCIEENDWNIRVGGQVEIIGWLYQYYNDEKKNQVINLNKGVVKKEDIPAATQLFTTDWVVRYIVDNSLGRYWIERNPHSELKNKLDFFIENKDETPQYMDEKINPEDITVFDPCVGSGHFIVYAFEVLLEIYIEYGYSEREAVANIVEKNLFGIDIDERSAQLAYFAVMMKARQYDRRFFSRGIQPHVYAITESNNIDKYTLEYFCNDDEKLIKAMHTIVKELHDAKEYGSILTVTPQDWTAIYLRFAEIFEDISIAKELVVTDLLPLVQVAEIISKKYAVVVTNPPYLNKYNPKLKQFLTDNYKDYAGDMFSVFIYKNFQYCEQNGYLGFMTPYVWMFIQTYENLRRYILTKKSITSLIQLEYSAFEEATVPICTFVLQNKKGSSLGSYIKLSDFKGGMLVQREKVLEAIKNPLCGYMYWSSQEKYLKITGNPIAFWISDKVAESFSKDNIGNHAFAKAGIVTGDDKVFLRFWYEIDYNDIKFDATEYEYSTDLRWVPMNKGGSYRKYYGNYEYVMDIYNLWTEGKTNKSVRRGDVDTYFKEAFTWSMVTSSKASFRYSNNKIFGVAAPAIFLPEMKWSLLGYLNSKVVEYFNNFLNPTINILTGNILSLPFIEGNKEIDKLVEENVSLEKWDWDNSETSWDFNKHFLLEYDVSYIEEAFKKWSDLLLERREKFRKNENSINQFYIDAFELEEIDGEITDEDITMRKADVKQDIISFISYAIGCMFGRYSLDNDGLVYAGGEWDTSKYKSFLADRDSIIPICDDEYFEDDIVGRFVKFVGITFGEESLNDNLKFIADALGGKGQPKEVIRNYFLNDFYNDHLKMYQKRPIYWLFDSGKKNGFKALIYMHRYQPDTIARIRTDYVHEQQARYRTAIADLENRIASAATSERVKLNKKLTTLKAQEVEIRAYEEKIHHLADQMIPIDLDDGVKVNYDKFKDVLAKIK